MSTPLTTPTVAPGLRAGSEPTVPSLLYLPSRPDAATRPATLADLHLDTVIDAMAPGAFQRTVWTTPPHDPAEVAQRQDVVRDLQRPATRAAAESFAAAVSEAVVALDARAHDYYRLPAQVRLLSALHRFAEEVRAFTAELAREAPNSHRLRAVAEALTAQVAGTRFAELADGSAALLAELCQPSDELGIVAETVWADTDQGDPPWTPQVAALLGRLADPDLERRDGSLRSTSAEPPERRDGSFRSTARVPARAVRGSALTSSPVVRPRRELNHIEAQALGLLAQLRPAGFERLRAFLASPVATVDAPLRRLAEELRFFLGCLTMVDDLTGRGVAWCRPRVTEVPGAVDVHGVIDLALALAEPTLTPAPNDVRLSADQRVVFVTGPNQGGKTTLVRAIGQLAHLAALGLPVPATSATLPLHHPLLTHFPQPDDPAHGHGGLAEELARLRAVLDAASAPALVIFNELLATTSADDALQVSQLVLRRFAELGCRVVWVTFLDDLVTSVPEAVSLVGQVDPDDPTVPTFRFRAQPPAGHSHAVVLARRFGLSADDLAVRLATEGDPR